MNAMSNPVHNNVGLVNNLNDLLREFSIETQKEFEHLSGTIESANKSGLLDPENYEQLMNREKFNVSYEELVEHCCMDLCMKMYGYLDELARKMEEYNRVQM